jgi:hypothetical protein
VKHGHHDWHDDFPLREHVEDFAGRTRTFVIDCHETALGFTVRARQLPISDKSCIGRGLALAALWSNRARVPKRRRRKAFVPSGRNGAATAPSCPVGRTAEKPLSVRQARGVALGFWPRDQRWRAKLQWSTATQIFLEERRCSSAHACRCGTSSITWSGDIALTSSLTRSHRSRVSRRSRHSKRPMKC